MGLFGIFKKKKPIAVDSNIQTIYFKNGKLYKVQGKNESNWYDADILVSDGISYNLNNTREIESIPIPNFGITDSLSGYGATGMLDYVLRMKSGCCFNKNEKWLCSALLWKSTEMMFANKYCIWRQRDFERLIDWHIQMDMLEEAEKGRHFLEENGFIIIKKIKTPTAITTTEAKKKRTSASTPKMTPQEKELFLVQHVTTDDMRDVPNLPFDLNCDVKKYIREGNHPFAYMDVIGKNIDFVKSELNKINSYIDKDSTKYKKIPPNARIPIREIVFHSSDLHSYSKFICTPKTPTGKIAKYPFKIYFCTDMNRFNSERYSTHGEIVYNQAGTIASANVYCWRPSGGFFIYYKTIDGKLVLSSAEKSGI